MHPQYVNTCATASVAIKNIKMYFSIYLCTCLKQLPNKLFTFCVFHIPNIICRWYFLFVDILNIYKTKPRRHIAQCSVVLHRRCTILKIRWVPLITKVLDKNTVLKHKPINYHLDNPCTYVNLHWLKQNSNPKREFSYLEMGL